MDWEIVLLIPFLIFALVPLLLAVRHLTGPARSRRAYWKEEYRKIDKAAEQAQREMDEAQTPEEVDEAGDDQPEHRSDAAPPAPDHHRTARYFWQGRRAG